MSDKRYLGNIITQNPTAPDGDFANNAAKGVWSLEEQLAYQKAGLWPVPGNFPLNVEEVFSTYLYTGNASTQTITNGIDLSGEGGLVWVKGRSGTAGSSAWGGDIAHNLFDSSAPQKAMNSALTNARTNFGAAGVNFTSTGFTVGYNGFNDLNYSTFPYVSWSFRKAPKFFDVVTYTGDGVAGRTVSHNLGSVPGCIIVKCTNNTTNWMVYHRGLDVTSPEDKYIRLNMTNALSDSDIAWNDTAPTSTDFTLGSHTLVNGSGKTYVAYLFAHNDGDGDFGPDGDADIIKCGSYQSDGNGSEISVDLGFEPQFVMAKAVSTTGNWHVQDSMRGMAVGSSNNPYLQWNTSDSESADGTAGGIVPTSNGFRVGVMGDINIFNAVQTYIYIAIRRGTKVPESGTEVFGISYAQNVNAVPFPVDFMLNKIYGGGNTYARDRLRGGTKYLLTETTNADLTGSDIGFDDMTGNTAVWGTSFINYNWKRAPKYMDVVAYTGDGTTARAISHNLGVPPQLMIHKRRNATNDWYVPDFINSKILLLNTNAAAYDTSILANYYGSGNGSSGGASSVVIPDASTFTVTPNINVNGSGDTYVVYLFATLAGISKVGSVTHSGTTNVDCGFTSGARFVLLKRTDATGDWYVWDSERGIVSGNDPYFLLNTTAAQVTSTDYIDPLSSGFTITSSFTAGDYIFYAIA
ncbi:hypothetical protein N8591_01500 [bacterium]|nr:hypothetical protein [bacterium]